MRRRTLLSGADSFSPVTSTFIIDIRQPELRPDYERINNALLEMLLKPTTGTFPPDPVIVQVQRVSCAT